MKEKFNISGMTCAACVAHVQKAVESLEGTENVNVNLLTNSMHQHRRASGPLVCRQHGGALQGLPLERDRPGGQA